MQRLTISVCLALTLGANLAWTPVVRADNPAADKILDALKSVEMPRLDPAKRSDATTVREYLANYQKASAKRSELIGALYQIDPENEELAKLMGERWQSLMSQPNGIDRAWSEIDAILASSKNEKLKLEAAFWKASLAFRMPQESPESRRKLIDAFIALAPKDARGAQLLYMVATQADPNEQLALYKKITREYPISQYAFMARGSLQKLESVGKPFELEFTEAIKGSTISMKDLRGKVVVIDFWATWCGPCVAEMPNMKKLYAKYRDKGVEFIGVSLDMPNGGLEKLKEFVEKNEIAWPQYYQGKGWDSDFSKSWGINSIPCVFLVDQEGKLASTEARGKLQQMIPKLLGEEIKLPDPAVTPTGKDISGFNYWVYEKDESGKPGYLKKEDGKNWVEMKDGRLWARFEETRRTADFVEMHDAKRNLTVRLYDGPFICITPGEDKWYHLPFSATPKDR
jgi:thiol-disulfide isomerase/thioredoxin